MTSYIRLLAFFILTTGLTSCFYSTKYVATYHIQPTTNIDQTAKEVRTAIEKLSLENNLMIDKKYTNTDTLGYFGNPYHYFKYWTSKQDSTLRLSLNYYGAFGNRKQPPYETMLNQLTENLNSQFNVVDSKIDEESNRKLKRKKN